MDFERKLKIRLWNAIVCIVLGIALIVIANVTKARDSFISSFGFALALVGAMRVRNYLMITKNEETIRKQQIAESDERNIAISNKAKSLAFGIYVCIAGAVVIALEILNITLIATVVAYSVCAMLILYWVAYWIVRRKY